MPRTREHTKTPTPQVGLRSYQPFDVSVTVYIIRFNIKKISTLCPQNAFVCLV